jgi:hypothetical protein
MTSEMVRHYFSTWIQLRHYELNLIAPEPFEMMVGVLLSRGADSVRAWDTSMVAIQGQIDIEPETVKIWRRVWSEDSASR